VDCGVVVLQFTVWTERDVALSTMEDRTSDRVLAAESTSDRVDIAVVYKTEEPLNLLQSDLSGVVARGANLLVVFV
jgi:hypothetical protein